MGQKHRFVSLVPSGRFTLTELCADFKVSRKTGHKWLRRYQTGYDPGKRPIYKLRVEAVPNCPDHTGSGLFIHSPGQ